MRAVRIALVVLPLATGCVAAMGAQLLGADIVGRKMSGALVDGAVNFDSVTFTKGQGTIQVSGLTAWKKARMGQYNIEYLTLDGRTFTAELLDQGGKTLLAV